MVVEGEATGFFSSSSESFDGSDGCDVEERPNRENNIPPSPFPMLAAPACHKTVSQEILTVASENLPMLNLIGK